jgi:multiple sugar transport system permease protein
MDEITDASSETICRMSNTTVSWRMGQWIDTHIPLVFNIPTVFLLLSIIGFPVILIVWTSLTDWYLPATESRKFVGFLNFIEMWNDVRWLKSIWRTFYFAGASVAIQLVLSLGISRLFNREFVGKSLYRTIFLLPMIAMPTAISIVWLIFYDESFGLLNHWLFVLFGLGPVSWVTGTTLTIPSLVFVSVWQHTPLMVLLILAGLQSLPVEPFEAARVDGATRWKIFFFITLPLLRGHIVVAVILSIIIAIKEFDIFLAITGGGLEWSAETMNMNIYFTAFDYGYMGMAAAKGLFFFAVIVVIQLALIRLRKREWSY